MLREVNHTFLILVPKCTNAPSFYDFRPIACCNLIYKLISKVPSNMLKIVVGKLISHNKSAFLQGRHIGDCTPLAHELIRDFKKKLGRQSLCIKIDLQKAFDSIINREFMYYIMQCMNFPPLWIAWIQECLATPTFSI